MVSLRRQKKQKQKPTWRSIPPRAHSPERVGVRIVLWWSLGTQGRVLSGYCPWLEAEASNRFIFVEICPSSSYIKVV